MTPAIRFVLTCYITHAKHWKRYKAVFLLCATIYIIDILYLHNMTSNITHDIPYLYLIWLFE